MKPDLRTPPIAWAGVWALLLALLQACSTPPASRPGGIPPERPADKVKAPAQVHPPEAALPVSNARNDKAYRQDAAHHLYARQAARIYAGRLPPMLYAVGVLHVDIDRKGQVQALRWQRAPHHAPEVVAEIEQMVRTAAPFPAPRHLGKVTYTDVWLWHKSGRFQLDTLTEGQD